MTRILIITRAFPWLPGEQFIEPEAPFWDRDDAEVVVMPWKMDGKPRPVPESVRLDDCLARITGAQRRSARLAALRSPLLRRELVWLARQGRLNRATAKEALRAVSGALVHRDALAAWIEANGPIDVLYSYWWDVWTFGAQLLKGKGVGHVVTRAHRYDLYEDRHPSGYLGLHRQLGRQLDLFLPISGEGERYGLDTYGLDPARVRLSPLGVELPHSLSSTSPEGELNLLSVAFMSRVKRIDRIVDALALLCAEHPELTVRWTHFGGGELMEEMRERLAAHQDLSNLHAVLAGSVDNDRIRQHLDEEPVDLFVNSSESEGVPVSIMEAMAFGVPTLAPDVGGISDLVPAAGGGGELLGAMPEAREIADALWRWHDRAKDPDERQAAHRAVQEGFDQAKNYAGLMDLLVSMAASGAAEA
ncbi:glycosyltransferase [Luteococcus peritonei]|uniref:Glycosyltransferase n=1 Tax=Luteococcus peritonei TaxID=88874 RepID=A0ABW4RY99_9ACTN